MNITELDSYNLEDAVKFNDQLNPRLWDDREHLRPEVRERLLEIADDFREFLGVTDLAIQDITISGSNAAYTYTPNSDIDLHLVVDMPDNPVYRELFDAKKFQYNEQHDIKIGGADVELYVQDADKPHISQGIYSLLNNDWLQIPRRVKSVVDDTSTRNKFEKVGRQIESAIKSGSLKRMTSLAEKIKKMRQTGLEAHGEFGPENLAFKLLRSQGLIKQLYDARNAAKDKEFSLAEKTAKPRVTYGFRTPTVVEADTVSLEAAPAKVSDEEILRNFIDFCSKELELESMPMVKLRKDPQWSVVNRTFGRYIDDHNLLEVAWGQRHIMDVLRTVAHELTHRHQHERESVPGNAGETGSPYENEANARAGVLMRDYAQQHPEYFAVGQAENLKEEIEKAYGILGYKVVVKGEYFYVYQGDQLIYRSVAPRTYTYDQLVNQVKRAISVTGSTIKNPAVMSKPKFGLEDAYKKLIQIITYRVDRNLDVTPETIKKEVEKIAIDYQVPEKDLRAKWAQTKISKYSNYQRSKYTKSPELFSAFEQISKYFQDQSRYEYNDKNLYKIRMAGQEDQWIENKMQEFIQKHGLSVTESASGYISTKKQANNLHEEEVDEGIKGATVATLSACIIGGGSLSGCATQQGMRPMDAARIIYNAKQYNNTVIQADVAQELNNFIRAQRGEVNAQNQSRLYQLQKQNQQKPPGPTNEGASGYIPTKAQAKDPRYSMALTVDIKPGQIGKEANKLNLKTNKQGVPQIAKANGLFEKLALELAQFKENIQAPVSKNRDEADYYKFLVAKVKQGRELTRHEKEFLRSYKMFNQKVAEKKLFALAESEQLDEVKMSPSALMKWATSPEAEGIRAGFEAELIFRDTTNGDDDSGELEPDYDADERVRSISQIIEFFNNGEYGGLSSRQEARLQEQLDEAYYEWYDEQMIREFRDEAEDLIRKVLVDEGDWDEDDEIQKQLALLDLSDEEINEIIKAGEQAPRFTRSSEQQAYAKENPLYEKYLDAQSEAEGLLDDLVADEVRKEGANWDAALDNFRDNYQIDDDSGFFDDAGLRYMSDVASEYSLDWPYMTGGGGNDGGRDWDDIGNSLQSVVDMPVKVSSNYHSTTRKEGLWIVEPDSSLSPDDSEDFGLEIVSPPMPLLVALEKLQQVTDWANSTEGNAYTNSTTGLHMGVSVPYRGGDVDYLKLILFLGDEYVLQQFGREANTYTKSAMKGFRENLKSGRSDPAGAMKLMQHGLLELAQREIQKGVGQSKYTSAHIQNGYIEFRSAGGDWLAEESADPEKLSSTMLRYARAMQIAADPSAERREFAKKLYKLVAPEGDSQLALFSQYAAGELTAEQLKKKWAEKTIGNEKKINQYFKLYQKVNGVWTAVPGAEYRGFQEDEVKNRVWMKYGREALDSGEYQLVNMSDNQQWEVYDVKTGETLEIMQGKSKDAIANDVYEKYAGSGIGFNVRPYVDPATLTPRAKLAKRIAEPKKPTEYNYEIVNLGDVNLRVVDKFYADSKQDADKTFDKWLEMKGLPNDTSDYGYRPRKQEQAQSRDDRQDSADLQARLTEPIQDIEPDVAQNFGNQFSGQWRVMIDGEEVWRFRGVGNNQADANRIAQTWLQDQRSQGSLSPAPGADVEVLPVMIESIDPVSGAGAIPPRQDPKNTGKKSVPPVEKARQDSVKGLPHRSAIGQAISKQDLENMTQQIQAARKLGDSVMEMEDTPPEVLRALDQAAQKNGYRNWADVKANPRSNSAVMNVAKLANNIMKTSGPHHEKLFYKSKTDENFADGKGPGRPGDSQRHGIPKGATMAELEKAAKAPGRKGQLARWQINMRRGKKK